MSALSDLMAKKAEDLTDEDVENIVITLREQRKNFNAEEVKKANAPKKADKAALPPASTLDLSSLGL